MQTIHTYKNDFEPSIKLPKYKKKLYRFYQYIGLSLTSFAIAMFIYSYAADISSASDIIDPTPKPTATLQAKATAEPSKAKPVASGYEVADEANTYGVSTRFAIVVPKIEAYSDVTANVSVSNKEEYEEALKHSVAHAKGTKLPGQGSTVYLFSHSTDSLINIKRYNAVFYDLKKLDYGDQIIIYHDHKKYVYKVHQKEVVGAKDTSWLNLRDEETLILQTCDPPGTTWKRLLIIAKPV